MKKANITISYNEERLNAIRLFLVQKNMDFDSELEGFLDALYKKVVPLDVRRFFEMKQDCNPAKPPVKARKSNVSTPKPE